MSLRCGVRGTPSGSAIEQMYRVRRVDGVPECTCVPAPKIDILLIGAGGLVGSAIRDALVGRPFVATAHERAVPGALTVDVTDGDALRALVREARPRAVILAAAAAYVERCEQEPAATRAVNVEPARILAEEVRALAGTLVVLSSEYVFDGGLGRAYHEADAVSPLNEYGRQKVELERIAATAGSYLVCRTSGVFGPEAARKNFVLSLVDTLRAGRRYAVPSDQLITPTYAPALGRAIVELLDAGATGTVNACGPRVLRRIEFAGEVASCFALPQALIDPRPTAELGLAARRPLAAGLSDGRLRALLGHGLPDPLTALDEMRRAGA